MMAIRSKTRWWRNAMLAWIYSIIQQITCGVPIQISLPCISSVCVGLFV